MLEGPKRGHPRIIEVACKIESPRIPSQRAREDLVCARLRELDRTATAQNSLSDTAVDRNRAHHMCRRLDVGGHSVWMLFLRPISELKKTTMFDGALPAQGRSRRTSDSKLRVIHDDIVRQRANPSKQGPGRAVPDPWQVVLQEQLRHELMVACRSSMLGCFDRQPSRSQPTSGVLMDLSGRIRVQRVELSLGVLGEERVDTEPIRSL